MSPKNSLNSLKSHSDISAPELCQAWESQQRAYIEKREERTEMIIRVLMAQEKYLDHPLQVLDLACGTGSLSRAVLAKLPESSVVGIDYDPVLLRLAKENTEDSRFQTIECDITGSDWFSTQIPKFDAVISATALHWLDPQDLVNCYLTLPKYLNSGGIFLNADHLYFDKSLSWLRNISESIRSSFQEQELAKGVMSWDSWWEVALTQPGWEYEIAVHNSRWAEKHETIKVSVDFHLAALTAAGFTEVAQIWQFLDDRIIFGRLP